MIEDWSDFPIAPNTGFEYLCDFMRMTGYCTEGERLMPFTAQEVLAQCQLFGVELTKEEGRVVCSLSKTFVSAVDKYSNNADALNPYGG